MPPDPERAPPPAATFPEHLLLPPQELLPAGPAHAPRSLSPHLLLRLAPPRPAAPRLSAGLPRVDLRRRRPPRPLPELAAKLHRHAPCPSPSSTSSPAGLAMAEPEPACLAPVPFPCRRSGRSSPRSLLHRRPAPPLFGLGSPPTWPCSSSPSTAPSPCPRPSPAAAACAVLCAVCVSRCSARAFLTCSVPVLVCSSPFSPTFVSVLLLLRARCCLVSVSVRWCCRGRCLPVPWSCISP